MGKKCCKEEERQRRVKILLLCQIRFLLPKCSMRIMGEKPEIYPITLWHGYIATLWKKPKIIVLFFVVIWRTLGLASRRPEGSRVVVWLHHELLGRLLWNPSWPDPNDGPQAAVLRGTGGATSDGGSAVRGLPELSTTLCASALRERKELALTKANKSDHMHVEVKSPKLKQCHIHI